MLGSTWHSGVGHVASGSNEVCMGCSVSHHPGHGHQGTHPSWTSTAQFLLRASTVTTVALRLCICVTKCVCTQDLPGAASWTVSPQPSRSASLHHRGLVTLLAGEKEKSPRQTAIDGCGGGGTDRYWRYRRAWQTAEQIERYSEQRDTAGEIGR